MLSSEYFFDKRVLQRSWMWSIKLKALLIRSCGRGVSFFQAWIWHRECLKCLFTLLWSFVILNQYLVWPVINILTVYSYEFNGILQCWAFTDRFHNLSSKAPFWLMMSPSCWSKWPVVPCAGQWLPDAPLELVRWWWWNLGRIRAGLGGRRWGGRQQRCTPRFYPSFFSLTCPLRLLGLTV